MITIDLDDRIILQPELADCTVEVRQHPAEGGFVIYIEREVKDGDEYRFDVVAVSDFKWPTQEAAARAARAVSAMMGFAVGTNPV